MERKSHNQIGDRKPCVAGSFYPADKEELQFMLNDLFYSSPSNSNKETVRAIIVPHAGYIYSGEVAAAGYKYIPCEQSIKNIFILGSSHRVSFNGASVYNKGDYLTPLGKSEVNKRIGDSLIEKSDHFSHYPPAHSNEHSLEVQVPMIQHLFGTKIKIIPIILGSSSNSTLEGVASSLRPWFVRENLFVISSDFSHYPSYSEAVRIDKATADALITGDRSLFLKELNSKGAGNPTSLSTKMCGWSAAVILLELLKGNLNLKFKHITYKNSGDIKFGDHNRVVGYHALALIEPDKYKLRTVDDSSEAILSSSDKEFLLSIARDSIESHTLKRNKSEIDYENIPSSLSVQLSAFVSIMVDGKLRGCIGRFETKEPVWKAVKELARAAGFNDLRFNPITKKELSSMQIEISVLTPLRRIKSIDEIILGKHGVYLKKGNNSGTFLPKVASGKNWSIEEFLGRISRDKAGIGWSGWKDSEIFIYDADTFEEK